MAEVTLDGMSEPVVLSPAGRGRLVPIFSPGYTAFCQKEGEKFKKYQNLRGVDF